MTLGQRRTLHRVRNNLHGLAQLLGFAAVLCVIAVITLIAHAILGR